MNIGIFGGTFDPPHNGHINLAEAVIEKTGIDRIIFILSAAPPHKPGLPISPFQHRMNMLELAIEGIDIFSDISRSHPNYEAIKYLKNNNIIDGYSDGTFKPAKTVNRAEALKMLMLAFDIKENGNGILGFSDVDVNAWYASALSAALNKGIVQGYSDGTFKPSKTVNRAEYLKILFATNNMKPNSNITKPYNDVSLTDWFAGYAFLANKMNILDTSNNLNPTNGMTRADVAETIYRMKMIQDNNLVTYSK